MQPGVEDKKLGVGVNTPNLTLICAMCIVRNKCYGSVF